MAFDPKSKIHRLLRQKKADEKTAALLPGGIKRRAINKINAASNIADIKKILKFMIRAGTYEVTRNV